LQIVSLDRGSLRVIVETSKDLKVKVGDERRDSGSRTRNAVPPPTTEVLEVTDLGVLTR
jgi:hypothetical protein